MNHYIKITLILVLFSIPVYGESLYEQLGPEYFTSEKYSDYDFTGDPGEGLFHGNYKELLGDEETIESYENAMKKNGYMDENGVWTNKKSTEISIEEVRYEDERIQESIVEKTSSLTVFIRIVFVLLLMVVGYFIGRIWRCQNRS